MGKVANYISELRVKDLLAAQIPISWPWPAVAAGLSMIDSGEEEAVVQCVEAFRPIVNHRPLNHSAGLTRYGASRYWARLPACNAKSGSLTRWRPFIYYCFLQTLPLPAKPLQFGLSSPPSGWRLLLAAGRMDSPRCANEKGRSHGRERRTG